MPASLTAAGDQDGVFSAHPRNILGLDDQAGNVLSINNWKPDYDINIASNPGGDSIIIFVGLAPPPAPAH